MRKVFLRNDKSKYSLKQIFRWMMLIWRGNYLQTILNTLLGIIDVGISLGQVWAVKHAIDIASHNIEGSIYLAVGILALLIAANFASAIASTWVQNILGIRAQNHMQQQMFDRILRSEWQSKEKMHSGDMINRLESDISSVVSFVTQSVPSIISTLLLFFGAFFYLYSLDGNLALIVIFLIPIFLLLSKVYIGRMRQLNRKVRESDSQVQSILQETVQNRMLIKTLESDDEMVGRLEMTHSELHHRIVKRTRFSVTSRLIVNMGFAFTYLLAFLWAALRLSANTLTYGGMAAFLQLVNKIQMPARQLMNLVPHAVAVITAAERLMELEENPLEEQGNSIWMGNSRCGMRLEDVTYQYPDADIPTIENLNFNFTPGSCTAIMGETGSGKTTLIRLLLSLFHPNKGSVIIYNNEGEEHEMSPLLRCNLVYVPQGNTLMSGTIRDNLLLGKSDATEEEMKEALRLSCADHVLDTPLGLDTPCSEKGGGFSEGQAQRIAIARALLRNRPIMIFDEATSALDIETERRLLQNILSEKDKTIIFITHRMAVVDYCDNILEIHSTD